MPDYVVTHDPPGDFPTADETESQFLASPASVSALEETWHEIFPSGKPFSIGMTGGSDTVWETCAEDAWMNFLESEPSAFDSLDILDDLANAVFDHEQWHIPGLDEKLLQPILLRSKSIIERALLNTDNTRLLWGHTENRPALRCLVHLVYTEEQRGNAYGKALGLYRLGDRENAHAALDEAVAILPKIPRFLTAKRVRKPKTDPLGILIGGDDQAWIYRQDMRDVWLASRGAVAWLKSAGKPTR